MLRFSIGDVSEDRPALFVRLHGVYKWFFYAGLGGLGLLQPPGAAGRYGGDGRGLLYFTLLVAGNWTCTCTIAGTLDEPLRGAPLGQGQGVEAPRAGRRSGFPSENSLCFLEQYPWQGGASSGTPTRVPRSHPWKVIRSEFRLYSIHDRVRSQIQAGKSSTSTTSGFPAHFASRTPLGTPCFYALHACMHACMLPGGLRCRGGGGPGSIA